MAIITDRDAVVAVAGAPKKQWVDRPVVPVVEKSMESRKSMILRSEPGSDSEDEQWDFAVHVIAPIIAEGDPIGTVILGTNEPNRSLGELELKLCETAAGFLGKQMEQ